MRKTRINASMLLFVSLLGLSSIVCVAAGLGNMHVESALGQPLKARIDLIGASSSDVGSMKVSLASAHSYKEIGAPYSATLASMRLVIVSGSAGTKPYVQVTSAVPVNDPAVDLLVKLSSADGTLVHEYPLLLDPVGYDTRVSNLPVINPQPVPRLSAASTTRRPPASSKTASIPALSATTGVEKRAGILGVHVQKGGLPYKKHSLIQKINRIKVHKGDSLTSIVLHAEPQVIDLDQALVAVYDANPHAFMGHNMNRLKSGVILQLPSVSEQKKVSPEKAMKQVAIQSRNWRIYRQKLAKAVMSERGRITARRHYATGTITAVTHGTSNKLTKTHDVLKVTRGTVPSGQKTPEAVKHQDEVAAMQEDAIANQARLKEANARISQLEKTIKDLQALVAIKGRGVSSSQPVSSGPAQSSVVTQAQHNTPKKESAPLVSKKLSASLFSGSLLYAVGGAVLLLLVLILVYLRQKGKSAGSPDGGGRITPFIAPLSGAAEAGSDEQDFIAAHEADPVVQAEIFIAHERYDQARAVLLEAIEQQGDREDLAYKLLEVFFLGKETDNFISHAAQYQHLYAQTHLVEWATICEWGSMLMPGQDLFLQEDKRNISTHDEEQPVSADSVTTPIQASESQPPHKTMDLDTASLPSEPGEETISAGSLESVSPVENPPHLNQPESIDHAEEKGADEGLSTKEEQSGEKEALVSGDAIDEIVTVAAPASVSTEESGMYVLGLPEEDPSTVSGQTELQTVPGTVSSSSDEMSASVESVGQDVEEASAPKINLDYSFGEEAKPDSKEQPQLPVDVSADGLLTLPDFDFGGINLNLESAEIKTDGESFDFSDDVATRLDLAKAYLDMGDQEGAREILAEIKNEGSEIQQKEIAQLIEKCQ